MPHFKCIHKFPKQRFFYTLKSKLTNVLATLKVVSIFDDICNLQHDFFNALLFAPTIPVMQDLNSCLGLNMEQHGTKKANTHISASKGPHQPSASPCEPHSDDGTNTPPRLK